MTSISKDSVKDAGKVRIGGGIRRVTAAPAKPATVAVKDSGKVRIGGGIRRRPA